jgi:23S rRNA pseudouridine1911/1915/1917 synthase
VTPPRRHGATGESPGPDDERDPSHSLVRPGGKVDPDAVRAAAEGEALAGDDDGLRRARFHLQRDLQKRLDKYLTDRIPFMSRTALQRLVEEGGVTVNGRRPKPSTLLRKGDVVEVVIPPPPAKEIQAQEIPLDVLYEDGQIIVINKRADILVHPARSHLSGTMVNALAWHFRNASETGGELSPVGAEFARPGVVHRLDRHTTGVIVFAKDEEAHWRLGRQFELRTTQKRYLAVVHGVVEPLTDTIELPLGPHPSDAKGLREKYVVRFDERGKPSTTVYRALEVFDGYTLLELELRTGRTHQIRVHLSYLGFPIVGDDMYGGRSVSLADLARSLPTAQRRAAEQDVVIARQALHAALLSFRHPVSGETLTFRAPPPPDLARLVALLRLHKPGRGPTGITGTVVEPPKTAGKVEPDPPNEPMT